MAAGDSTTLHPSPSLTGLSTLAFLDLSSEAGGLGGGGPLTPPPWLLLPAADAAAAASLTARGSEKSNDAERATADWRCAGSLDCCCWEGEGRRKTLGGLTARGGEEAAGAAGGAASTSTSAAAAAACFTRSGTSESSPSSSSSSEAATAAAAAAAAFGMTISSLAAAAAASVAASGSETGAFLATAPSLCCFPLFAKSALSLPPSSEALGGSLTMIGLGLESKGFLAARAAAAGDGEREK